MSLIYPDALQQDEAVRRVLDAIAAATRRRGLPTLPVLVNGPSTSSTVSQPPQAAEVHGCDHTDDDVDRLVDLFGDLATGPPPERPETLPPDIPEGIKPTYYYILILAHPV